MSPASPVDNPNVHPVIASFLRPWNDNLQSDDDRTRLLLPLVPRIIGTKGSPALEARRSLMAADWLVRAHTPALLRLAGLRDQAAHARGVARDHQLGSSGHAAVAPRGIYKDTAAVAAVADIAPDAVGAWAAGSAALAASGVWNITGDCEEADKAACTAATVP